MNVSPNLEFSGLFPAPVAAGAPAGADGAGFLSELQMLAGKLQMEPSADGKSDGAVGGLLGGNAMMAFDLDEDTAAEAFVPGGLMLAPAATQAIRMEMTPEADDGMAMRSDMSAATLSEGAMLSRMTGFSEDLAALPGEDDARLSGTIAVMAKDAGMEPRQDAAPAGVTGAMRYDLGAGEPMAMKDGSQAMMDAEPAPDGPDMMMTKDAAPAAPAAPPMAKGGMTPAPGSMEAAFAARAAAMRLEPEAPDAETLAMLTIEAAARRLDAAGGALSDLAARFDGLQPMTNAAAAAHAFQRVDMFERMAALGADYDGAGPENALGYAEGAAPAAMAGAEPGAALRQLVATPGMAQAAIVQTAAAMVSATGDDEIQIHLDPPELGNLMIKMQFGDNGVVTAMISAEHAETRDMFEANQDALREALREAGYNQAEFRFEHSDERADPRRDWGAMAAPAEDGAAPAGAEARPRAGRMWSLNGVDVRV